MTRVKQTARRPALSTRMKRPSFHPNNYNFDDFGCVVCTTGNDYLFLPNEGDSELMSENLIISADGKNKIGYWLKSSQSAMILTQMTELPSILEFILENQITTIVVFNVSWNTENTQVELLKTETYGSIEKKTFIAKEKKVLNVYFVFEKSLTLRTTFKLIQLTGLASTPILVQYTEPNNIGIFTIARMLACDDNSLYLSDYARKIRLNAEPRAITSRDEYNKLVKIKEYLKTRQTPKLCEFHK